MAGMTVDGLDDVRRSLARFGVDVQDARAIFTETGQLMTDTEQQLTPVLSGALAATVIPTVGRNRVEVVAGQGLEYGGVIHYGWPGHNIEPQPFATDAVARLEGRVPALIETGVGDLIDKNGLS